MSVNEVAARKERPAYVRFKRVAVEDKAASLREGKYVAKDVDYALITPPYSKDVVEVKVKNWLEQLDTDLRNDRIHPEWVDNYKEAYRRWQNGQELPLNGTPIKGWGIISPAQQETLIRMNILTVEDLAGVNDEGMRRIGMGSQELKQKALAWLQSMKDHAPLTLRITALELENQRLTQIVEAQSVTIEELNSRLQSQSVLVANLQTGSAPAANITAADLLEDDEAPAKKSKK